MAGHEFRIGHISPSREHKKEFGSVHFPRNIRIRREFKSCIYIWRYVCFFAMSFCRFPIHVRLWGSPYYLQANRETLGINGHLYLFREGYESEVREALLRHFVDGWLFIDIGANSGFWSKFIARHFELSRIVAFEPGADTFKLLRENLKEFRSRVQLENVAVSDQMQTLYLVRMSDPGGRHLIPGPGDGAERVPAVCIDEEAKRGDWLNQWAGRCLVKLDVEGHEYSALKGARNFISTSRPIVVFEMLEENLFRAKITSDEILQFFADLNYTVFPLVYEALVQPLRRMREGDALVESISNFVAVPNEQGTQMSMEVPS